MRFHASFAVGRLVVDLLLVCCSLCSPVILFGNFSRPSFGVDWVALYAQGCVVMELGVCLATHEFGMPASHGYFHVVAVLWDSRDYIPVVLA